MKTEKTKRANLLFRLGCFLLAVTSFTCVALARYLSVRQSGTNADIAKLACSIRVDVDRNASSYSFFNTDYIIHDSVMNKAQVTGFVVNNCNLETDGTYSDPCGVDLRYELVLYVPVEFASVAAFQITTPEVPASGTQSAVPEKAVTPLYLLNEFVTGTNDKITVAGTNATYAQDSLAAESEIFNKVVANGTTFQWKSDKTELLIEKKSVSAEVQYVFQCFNHSPHEEYVEGSVATRLAPLYAEKKFDSLNFYEIRIHRTEFVIAQSDERQDLLYNLRTLSTNKLPDTELSMIFSEFDQSNTTFEYNGLEATLTSVSGKNQVWNISYGTENQETYIDALIQKDYPIRLNAIFTQTKIENKP